MTEEEIDSLMNTQMKRSINKELKSNVCHEEDAGTADDELKKMIH